MQLYGIEERNKPTLFRGIRMIIDELHKKTRILLDDIDRLPGQRDSEKMRTLYINQLRQLGFNSDAISDKIEKVERIIRSFSAASDSWKTFLWIRESIFETVRTYLINQGHGKIDSFMIAKEYVHRMLHDQLPKDLTPK